MTKSECQRSTSEDLNQYRTEKSYADIMKQIEEACSVELKDTKGLKFYCHLNNLKFFSIIDNNNVDIMHDLYEGGTVSFLIQNLLEKCIEAVVFTLDDITALMHYFDYGRLNRDNIPTTLALGSKSLGQNASQMRCLMLHIPFILHDFKDNEYLLELWECVKTMLKIITFVHSDDLLKEDLDNLKAVITDHLESVLFFFGKNLLPKHHFMTHYATMIRRIGPIVLKSCMKYEMKHKEFTDQVRKTNNYLNIGNSIGKKHQQLCTTKTNYCDSVNHAKLKAFVLSNFCDSSFVRQFYQNATEDVFITERAQVNCDVYLKNLFLIHENRLFEIQDIFKVKEDFHYLCYQFEISGFDSFLNSVEIKYIQPTIRKLIKHSELKITKSFETKRINEFVYIIVDTVEMLRLKQLYVVENVINHNV